VLLLEAGGEDLKPNVLITDNWYFNQGGQMDWNFMAEPNPAVNNPLDPLGVIGTDFEKHLISQTPLGRSGQPEDIAPVAVFLSSEAARWITGEILLASGGMR
jgi:NAD(P)-dependent dehydrogenase (short-subunit alcohol dehydrogenase family)